MLVRLERDGDPVVAAQALDLVLVEEGRPNQLLTVHTHPGQGDVRGPIGVDGYDVAQRAGGKEVTD